MNDRLTLRRLRGFLFALAAGLLGGTVAELLLAEHYDGRWQLVPFALCALGLLALLAAWWRPGRATILALRAVMLATAAGSVAGVAQHFLGNRGFALETRPEAGGLDLVEAALTGGVPLLAPGILAVAALVALAATYRIEVADGASASESGSVAPPGREAASVGSAIRDRSG